MSNDELIASIKANMQEALNGIEYSSHAYDCLMQAIGDFATVEAALSAADAERERLAATVGKLPTTADGVPIVPGMKVWLSDPDGVIECEVFSVPPSSVQVPVIISHADGTPVDVSKTELFSTEAAALAGGKA